MGKTKEVLAEFGQEIIFLFKDYVTGRPGEIDPGANEVIGKMAGKGRSSLSLSVYLFMKVERAGIPTHLISADSNALTMTARRAELFGEGLEFVCRRFACGSFLRRYGNYVEEMAELPYLVEVTLKDDERGDPLINDDALVNLGIITADELEQAKDLTFKVTRIIEQILAEKGLTLIDIKLEFGRVGGRIVLIDEISGDVMRVAGCGGRKLNQVELCRVIVG